MMCTVCAYREQESVFEVWVLSVALLAAVQSVVLVDHFLVAVCRWTGRVQTVLLPSVDHRRYTAEILRLRREKEMGDQKNIKSHETGAIWTAFSIFFFFFYVLSALLIDRTGLRYDRKWDEGGEAICSKVGLEPWAAVARTDTPIYFSGFRRILWICKQRIQKPCASTGVFMLCVLSWTHCQQFTRLRWRFMHKRHYERLWHQQVFRCGQKSLTPTFSKRWWSEWKRKVVCAWLNCVPKSYSDAKWQKQLQRLHLSMFWRDKRHDRVH